MTSDIFSDTLSTEGKLQQAQAQHRDEADACVRMVLLYLGLDRDEKDIEAILKTTSHGTKARDLGRRQDIGVSADIHPASLFELLSLLREGIPPIVFLRIT